MVSSISVTLAAIILYGGRTATTAFSPQYRHSSSDQHQSSKKFHTSTTSTSLCMISDREAPDEEGADMAAQFFKAVSERDISFEGDEIDFADADESEMLNDDGETVVYEGGDNASVELDDDDDAILREYDVTSGSALTNEQIYDEMKDRVFESAGAFVELTKGADESGTSEEDGFKGVYQPPSTEPDSGLTAGEVLENVLRALRNNDNPSTNYGIEVLFGYSSLESQIVELIETEGLTPANYRSFLLSSEDNMALFDPDTEVVIDRADFSPDSLKAYFTARLTHGSGDDLTVNFILSTTGTNDDDCWLIDSLLIRPPKMRNRRRR